jgi:hypothetical protein
MTVFDLGDTVPLGVAIRDANDALVTPGAIVLTITLPDGTSVTPTPATVSTGLYTADYVPVQAGRHLVRWTTTTPATAFTDTFDVDEAAPPLIIGLEEAKDFLNITDTSQDEELRAMIEGVTAVVESGDGKDFPGVGPVVRRTVTTVVRADGSCYEYPLPTTQILSLTSGAYLDGGGSVSLTGYTFDDSILRAPYGGYLPSAPWTLTYVVGRPSLPSNIRMGALEILKLAWASQRGGDQPAFLVSFRALAWLGSETPALGFA